MQFLEHPLRQAESFKRRQPRPTSHCLNISTVFQQAAENASHNDDDDHDDVEPLTGKAGDRVHDETGTTNNNFVRDKT